jgi:hypothetical protein
MDIGDFFRFLFKMTMSKSQLKKELQILRQSMSALKAKLIPFSKEEMELLSLNQSERTTKKGFGKITKGIFNTIYYEPLIAYAIKEFSNGQKLILIASTEDEFAYFTKDGKTHVYMNEVEAGIITLKGEFFSVRNQLLAVIDGADHIPTHAVWIQGKNIGFIANPKFAEKTIPRAFSLLKDMSENEQSIFLCLTLVNLIEEAQLNKIS